MDLMDLVTERVKILHEGPWEEKQVKTVVDKKFAPKITKKMKKIAKGNFAERKIKNPKLFDGDALHLNLAHSVVRPNQIILSLGPIKYSLYDIARKEFAEKYGWSDLPTGTGINAVIIAVGRKIVMYYRHPHVDFQAKIGTIGGIYQNGHPFKEIRREIREELRIKKREIKKLLLIGIAQRLDERINHELCFLVDVSLTERQVLERERLVKDKEGKVFFLSCSSRKVPIYLRQHHQNITSSSFAALVMAGHYLWGKNWSKV